MTSAAFKHLRTVVLRGGRMGRWKGSVVSFAPSMGGAVLPGLAASVSPLALAVAGMMAAATPAEAQCVEEPAVTFTCSGSLATTQSLTGPFGTNLTVTTTPGFNITTSTGNAFSLSNVSGPIVFDDGESGSYIRGRERGIYANLEGSGGVMTITASGDVIGELDDGIHARNEFSDLTLDVANVTGGQRGIYAKNYGAGLLSITASGDVVGENSSGIVALNSFTLNQTLTYVSGPDLADNAFSYSASGGGVTTMSDSYQPDERDIGLEIDVVNVTGASYGIDAKNVGGDRFGFPVAGNVGLTITASGSVTGHTSDGIRATNSRGALTLDVFDVDGDRHGIRTVQYSRSTRYFGVSAPLNVRISGTVQGGSGYGVYNTQASQGGTFTITQSGSLGAESGVAFRDASIPLDAIEGFSLIGADSRLIVEGALNGDALMGAGSDSIRISGGAATLGASVVLNGGDSGMRPVEPLHRSESLRPEGPVDIYDLVIDPPVIPPIAVLSETDRLFFEGWSGGIDAAQVVNWEEVIVTGGSDVVFSDAMSPGLGLRNAYTLRGITFNDLLLQVDEGSIARFAGDFTIDGDVDNFGTLDLSGANGTADTTLTIARDYTAASTLILDVELGDDSSPSDVLIIRGDTSGTTSVVINNTGGTGALTTGDGIRVIDTDPSNALDGEFVLAGPVIAGAYKYDLQSGPLMDLNDNEYDLKSASRVGPTNDGDWYLRSAGFQPGAPVYEALPSVLLGLNTVGTLAQRLEGRQALMGQNNTPVTISTRGVAATANEPNLSAVWMRIEGGRTDVTPDASSTGASYDQDTWRLQGGLDMMVYGGETGSLAAGINLFTGGSSVDVSAAAGGGGISTDANGVGLTATWYGNQGFYTDVQLQYTSLDSDLSSDVLGAVKSGLDGSGRLASIEMGQEFALPSGMTLTPQAQLTWSEVSFDSFTGPNGETVSLGDNDSLQLRLGLAAEQSWDFDTGSQARLYGIANVTHEMRDATSVIVSGTELSMSAPDWVGEIGLGGSYDWAREGGGTSSLYGEVSASRELSGGKIRRLSGTVGFRMEF